MQGFRVNCDSKGTSTTAVSEWAFQNGLCISTVTSKQGDVKAHRNGLLYAVAPDVYYMCIYTIRLKEMITDRNSRDGRDGRGPSLNLVNIYPGIISGAPS